MSSFFQPKCIVYTGVATCDILEKNIICFRRICHRCLWCIRS